MKRILFVFILVVACFSSVSAQKSKIAYEPKGNWLFTAPYAPEGFTSGTLEIGTAEKKLSAVMAFTGTENKMPLENVKFENDTLSAVLPLDGEIVSLILKFDEADKISGKAVYSQGEVPLSMTRDKKK